MGFSIWVADDPELESGVPSSFPHYSASNAAMAALRNEMSAQGMFEYIDPSKLAWCNGEHVSADELSAALAGADDALVTTDDAELRELWRSWIEFLRLAARHGGIVVN